MGSGYSGTPLVRKLGIKPGAAVALVGAPAGFEAMLVGLGEGVVLRRGLRGTGAVDVVVVFAKKLREMERGVGAARGRIAQNGAIWCAWPKRASGVETDITEDVVREVALANRLVDNKVCAIDEVWSGLRLVIRVAEREG